MTCRKIKRKHTSRAAAVLLCAAAVFCCAVLPAFAESGAVSEPAAPSHTVTSQAPVPSKTEPPKPAAPSSQAQAAPSKAAFSKAAVSSKATPSKPASSSAAVSRRASAAQAAVSSRAVSSQASSKNASSKASSAVSTAAGGIVLPSVGSISEQNMFSNPVDTTRRNATIDGVGIALWTTAVTVVVLIFLVVYRNRNKARKETVGHQRYRSVRRDKKQRLLGNKYYNDSKYKDE